jgi:hypothetical protein
VEDVKLVVLAILPIVVLVVGVWYLMKRRK